MADVDFDEFDGDYAAPHAGRTSRLVNLAGAACSIVLIIGVAVWGYKLAVRDVSGIPVVRALSAPMRIAPENPGGDVAMHQGLSVNAVAEIGVASPLPETLTLAPREMDLAEDDIAGTASLPALPADASDAVSEVAADVDPAMAVSPDMSATAAAIGAPVEIMPAADDAALPLTQQEAVAAALAAALADEPALEDTALVLDEVALDDAALAEEAPLDIGAGLAVSPRPQLRPETAAPQAPVADVETTADLPVAAVASAEIDPTTIAAGTRLVQLGAFDGDEAARTAWTALQGQFPDLLAAKAMVIQSAQSGGKTFYRLRAHGFADEDEARRFCAAMLAGNASCIPVAQR
jgi:hypothetical protein